MQEYLVKVCGVRGVSLWREVASDDIFGVHLRLQKKDFAKKSSVFAACRLR